MRTDPFALGSICIDGVTYAHDVVITRGRVGKRKKNPSKPFRDAFGHTPLSIDTSLVRRPTALRLLTRDQADRVSVARGEPHAHLYLRMRIERQLHCFERPPARPRRAEPPEVVAVCER